MSQQFLSTHTLAVSTQKWVSELSKAIPILTGMLTAGLKWTEKEINQFMKLFQKLGLFKQIVQQLHRCYVIYWEITQKSR